MVSTSEGDTATDTVWSGAASAGGGEVSSSETRISSSSATALTIVRLEVRCLLDFKADEMTEFLNWEWSLTQEKCE